MRRTLAWTGLLALAVLLPVHADDKKPDAGKMAGDKKEATNKLIAAGEVTGKVVNVESAKKTFTIQFPVQYAVPNPNTPSIMLQIAQQQQQMAASRNVQDAQSHAIEIAKLQSQLIQAKTENVSWDIVLTDDGKVRVTDPPPTFDDKGNPKKYTREELKQLKGDPKLPGYAAEFDDLRQEQVVTVSLARKKETKPKGKDELEENKYLATMVVIQPAPPVPPK